MKTTQEIIDQLRKENKNKIEAAKVAVTKELTKSFALNIIEASKRLVELQAKQAIYESLTNKQNPLYFLNTELGSLIRSLSYDSMLETTVDVSVKTEIKLIYRLISLFEVNNK